MRNFTTSRTRLSVPNFGNNAQTELCPSSGPGTERLDAVMFVDGVRVVVFLVVVCDAAHVGNETGGRVRGIGTSPQII